MNFFFEFLAPIIEALGIIYFIFLLIKGDVNWDTMGYIFLYSYSFGVFIGTLVVFYDNYVEKQYKTLRETLGIWILPFIEPFVYHPMLIFFSLKGYFNFFTSKRMEWGTMTRQGHETEKTLNLEANEQN